VLTAQFRNEIPLRWPPQASGTLYAYSILAPNHAFVIKPSQECGLARESNYRVVTDRVGRRAIQVAHLHEGEPVRMIDVISQRDRVAILGTVFDQAPADDCLPVRVEDACDHWMRKLLEERTKVCGWSAPSERRFLVQFDAWTRPDLRLLIGDRKRTADLSEGAKELFVHRCPQLDDAAATMGQIPGLVMLLEDRTQNRVYWGRGRLGADGDRLSTVMRSQSLNDDLIDELASYQEKIFDQSYPLRGGEVLAQGLLRAFALFAAGRLRFLSYPDPDPVHGLGSVLNAEPEGAMFFAFAEFALEAARVRPRRAAYWQELATLFAALQEVFCFAYGPPVGPRRFDSYSRNALNQGCSVDLATLERLIGHYKKWYSKADKLNARLNANATWALFDFDRQEPC
jgi:hypothetical protein